MPFGTSSPAMMCRKSVHEETDAEGDRVLPDVIECDVEQRQQRFQQRREHRLAKPAQARLASVMPNCVALM